MVSFAYSLLCEYGYDAYESCWVFGGRWKKLLTEETNAVDVVTFDYPCEYVCLFVCLAAYHMHQASAYD